jgi:hypothetical protein
VEWQCLGIEACQILERFSMGTEAHQVLERECVGTRGGVMFTDGWDKDKMRLKIILWIASLFIIALLVSMFIT